jgi:hypothetical protein
MEIYVKSRGRQQDNDYKWIKASNQQSLNGGSLPFLLKEATSLIDADSFAVVIIKKQGSLALLISGLSSSRTDYMGRIIHNSVCWIGKYMDEPVLRSIAARALRNTLQQEINNIIISGGNPGFQIIYPDIQELTSRNKETNFSSDKKQLTASEKRQLIGNISEKMKKELADTIDQYDFPETYEIPVIVTAGQSNIMQDQEKNYNIWRFLSKVPGLDDWNEFVFTKNKPFCLPFKTNCITVSLTISAALTIGAVLIVLLVLKFNHSGLFTTSSSEVNLSFESDGKIKLIKRVGESLILSGDQINGGEYQISILVNGKYEMNKPPKGVIDYDSKKKNGL